MNQHASYPEQPATSPSLTEPARPARLKSIPGAAVTGRALWAAARLRVAQWDLLSASPDSLRKAQLRTLLSHCRTAATTEFGRAHRLGAVRDDEDFRQHVPLRTYADFEPFLERMRKGARDVLWPGLIPYYGQSSGTSATAARNKFLPISLAQIRWQQRAGFDVMARYLALSGDTGVTGGYMLGLFPPGIVKKEGPVGVASNPGLMQLHMPLLSRPVVLPRQAVRDIEDYDRKLDTIAATYLDHDVRVITGTSCWFSILFDRVLAAARARGRRVQTVQQVWPNLRVLVGGGVPAEPYRRLIDERMGRHLALMDNYNATEGGIFAATDRFDDDALLVIPDRGVYFEFVPRGQEGPGAPRVPLWHVQTGVDYSVALTTSSGLFAYEIGDYVRFSSVFPHRLRFSGRKSGVLSLTQELTTQGEIERAVAAAAEHSGATVIDFAAGPDVGVGGTAKGRYTFFVEFDRPPADRAAFARAVDGSLCDQNRVYREHRAGDVAILAPELVPLPRGATRRFMSQLGQTSVQNKFPHIVDQRKSELLRSLASATTTRGDE